MYSGPKVKRDGLVFGYDTGEYSSDNPNRDKHLPHGKKGKGSHRFFKGRPTTNYLAFQNPIKSNSYASYTPTSDATWLANHADAIRVYNAQGTEVTQGPNTGVTNWTTTQHAHHILDEVLKRPVVRMNCTDSQWKAWNFGAGMSAWNSYGVTAGSKYVLSWLQWTNNLAVHADAGFYSRNTSNSNGFHDGRSGNVSTAKNTRLRTWQRVYCVFTVSSVRDLTNSYGAIYMYGQGNNAAGRELRLADVQLELNTDFPSAYLASNASANVTSRSSTEGLLDLAGTYSIDVSNISFNSNGQPEFDGTDDYIQINNLGLSSHTLEGIIKSNDGSQGGSEFSTIVNAIGNYDGGSSKYTYIGFIPNLTFRIDDGVSSHRGIATTSYSANTWYHVTLTYNASDGVTVAYLNGVQIGSTTSTTDISFDSIPFSIGKTVPNTYFNGNVPVVKVYNRALTAAEIKQNFSAYRKRFNIN